MATVADVIRRSLELLGVLAAGESLRSEDQADALDTLNDLVDSWAGERLTLYATLRSTHTLTPSLSPHTIGSGGTFSTTRPIRIERASRVPASSTGSEVPLQMFSDAEWQNAQGKTTTGAPVALWVDTEYPLTKLYLWPIPNAADTLVLYTWEQIGRFSAASSTFDLPPGYARALRYNLAVELAPAYGLSASPELANIANESKTTLKRLNHQTQYSRADAAVLPPGPFNIITGDR